MEIPDKIYLTSNDEHSYVFTQKRSDNKGIEYVRKDILIEKLCTWIKENSEMYIECEDHFYAGWLTEDFYKELRKAMEE